MKKILILQNIANEGPGLSTEFLNEAGLEFEIINRDTAEKNSAFQDASSKNSSSQKNPHPEKIPPLKNYSAMIVMGGTDSANEKSEKILGNLEAVREALKIGMPYFGICLGLQLGVKAAGGKVIKNPVREAGCRDPEGNFFSVLTTPGQSIKNNPILTTPPPTSDRFLTNAAPTNNPIRANRPSTTDPVSTNGPTPTNHSSPDPILTNVTPTSDPILTNLPQNFPVFHLHGETVELTPQMQLLGSGKFCANQFVKIAENAYGIQFHLELTLEMFEDWAANDPWLQKINQEQLRHDFALQYKNYKKILRQIFQNWTAIFSFE